MIRRVCHLSLPLPPPNIRMTKRKRCDVWCLTPTSTPPPELQTTERVVHDSTLGISCHVGTNPLYKKKAANEAGRERCGKRKC